MAVHVDHLIIPASNPRLTHWDASQHSALGIESYDPLAFDNLPLISGAVAKFDAINGETLVSTVFRELFLRYQMDRTFGLTLLHRHFDLDKTERLVDYGGTSVPWRLGKISGSIQASSWLLSDNGLRPYEFYYTSVRDEATEPDVANANQRAFFHDFKGLLSKYKAYGVFGLCRYPGDDFPGRVEVTKGRANINLKPDDVSRPITFCLVIWSFWACH